MFTNMLYEALLTIGFTVWKSTLAQLSVNHQQALANNFYLLKKFNNQGLLSYLHFEKENPGFLFGVRNKGFIEE